MTSARVTDILGQMTTEEKIGQLNQLSADFFPDGQAVITGPMKTQHMTLDTLYQAGSVLGISGAERVRKVQADYLAHNRLQVPLLFMADVVHGYRTIFPIPLALGASFDPAIVRHASAIAAKESAAGGVHVTFAPMVDLVRDPRWGRVMESTGEDPYLNSVLAEASVQGFQGALPLDNDHIAACVKHFAAYGAPEGGREYNTVDISEWRFKEQYLPSYAAAIKAQALLVMTSFNTLFGVPATGNQHLMRDILREELQFNGVLISDWDAIGELMQHGVAGSLTEAADLALQAGVDIDMMSFAFAQYLKRAARLDAQTQTLIDEAVRRVLELKETLGLFDDPYRGISAKREAAVVGNQDNMAAAELAAEQTMVLLKNRNQLLPLDSATKIVLIGPTSDTGDLLGSWSWQGSSAETETIVHAMAASFSSVESAPGCDYHALNFKALETAEKIGRNADVIVAALGFPSAESGEATSMTNIQLPAEQLRLLRKLATLGKPIVSLVVTGRPLDLTEVDALSDSVLLTWFPGSRGAQAITRIISGASEPGGRLPMSFPRTVGQVPVYYNHYHTGRPLNHNASDAENKYLSKYIDETNDPLYPFGFGLGYADIELKDLTIQQPQLSPNETLYVHVKVVNSADIDGQTVVQIYGHQLVGETVRPVKQLIGFKKVAVAAKQTVELTIAIQPEQLGYYHRDLAFKIDSGKYEIMAGTSSQTTLQADFTIVGTEKEDDHA